MTSPVSDFLEGFKEQPNPEAQRTLNEALISTRDFAQYSPGGFAVVTARYRDLSSDYWHLKDYAVTSRIGLTIYLSPKVSPASADSKL